MGKLACKSTTHTVASPVLPTLATDGIDLTNALEVNCSVSAESTRTITGGGMECYIYSPVLANADASVQTWRWVRFPAGDYAPAIAGRDAISGPFKSFPSMGRAYWSPMNVTVSAGTTVVSTSTVKRSE